MEVVFRSFEGATKLAGSRTILGLPDRDEAGEAVRCRRLAPRVIGLVLLVGLAVSCLTAPCWLSCFCDGDDPPIMDASSPNSAFTPALNFIGGTGISSSELSPIENFHAGGCADPLFTDWEANGVPRFRFGLDA